MGLWAVEESEDTRLSRPVVKQTQGVEDFGAGKSIDKAVLDPGDEAVGCLRKPEWFGLW
jgi:hypothetical protein